MRLDVHAAEAGNSPAIGRPPTRRRLDRVEAGVLAVFWLISLWTLALDLEQAHVHHLVWTGTDGVYIVDQLQYLSWIRSAAQHGLTSNLFVLTHTPADYLQPAVLISAGLTLLGLAPWLALLVWKPVAVLCTFFAFRAYIHRVLPGPLARRAALVLSVFYGSFTLVYGAWSVIGDLMPTFLTWGYTFGLLAMALMVASLVAYDRVRARPELAVIPGLLGALASLLHPWQGELLIGIVLGSELVLWWVRGRGSLRGLLTPALLATVALTALPLLYYLVLGRADPSWGMARDASKHAWSLGAVLLALVPLSLPAALAWRLRERSFLEVVTRVWVIGALAVWLFSTTALSATPLHAFDAITLPLAVLAAQGVGRLRVRGRPITPSRWTRGVLVLAVGVLTVPATAVLMNYARKRAAPTAGNPNFIRPAEQAALRYLDSDPTPGGVLSRFYLSVAVPADTGRRTYSGDCLWSEPDCNGRAEVTQALLEGAVPARPARTFVRATGARFLLEDCDTHTNFAQLLGPLVTATRHFGCAAVYTLRPGAPAGQALTESALDAALRAAGR
jgi:hypothetical protein